MKTTRKDEYIPLNPSHIDYRGLCAACGVTPVDQEGWLCHTPIGDHPSCAESAAAYRITRPVVTRAGERVMITWR